VFLNSQSIYKTCLAIFDVTGKKFDLTIFENNAEKCGRKFDMTNFTEFFSQYY